MAVYIVRATAESQAESLAFNLNSHWRCIDPEGPGKFERDLAWSIAEERRRVPGGLKVMGNLLDLPFNIIANSSQFAEIEALMLEYVNLF